MELVFATNNKHKLQEISHLLGDSFTLLSLDEIGLTEEIPEDYPTLEENAVFKAGYIHSSTGKNVFADDTGLEIFALDGKPGVHSARFAGDSRDFEANIDKVLALLADKPDRRARFRTIIALILNGKEYLFEGKVEGTIINERRGGSGFGYDPVFLPDGHDKTFAEMNLDEKNKISHRARAFIRLKEFLATLE
ncbi:MAG: RdgB/HAM1 family non-canonical purine NTP pyrophosphatase [Bacteroidales bacterium]